MSLRWASRLLRGSKEEEKTSAPSGRDDSWLLVERGLLPFVGLRAWFCGVLAECAGAAICFDAAD
jgi:hypothetical protein